MFRISSLEQWALASSSIVRTSFRRATFRHSKTWRETARERQRVRTSMRTRRQAHKRQRTTLLRHPGRRSEYQGDLLHVTHDEGRPLRDRTDRFARRRISRNDKGWEPRPHGQAHEWHRLSQTDRTCRRSGAIPGRRNSVAGRVMPQGCERHSDRLHSAGRSARRLWADVPSWACTARRLLQLTTAEVSPAESGSARRRAETTPSTLMRHAAACDSGSGKAATQKGRRQALLSAAPGRLHRRCSSRS